MASIPIAPGAEDERPPRRPRLPPADRPDVAQRRARRSTPARPSTPRRPERRRHRDELVGGLGDELAREPVQAGDAALDVEARLAGVRRALRAGGAAAARPAHGGGDEVAAREALGVLLHARRAPRGRGRAAPSPRAGCRRGPRRSRGRFRRRRPRAAAGARCPAPGAARGRPRRGRSAGGPARRRAPASGTPRQQLGQMDGARPQASAAQARAQLAQAAGVDGDDVVHLRRGDLVELRLEHARRCPAAAASRRCRPRRSTPRRSAARRSRRPARSARAARARRPGRCAGGRSPGARRAGARRAGRPGARAGTVEPLRELEDALAADDAGQVGGAAAGGGHDLAGQVLAEALAPAPGRAPGSPLWAWSAPQQPWAGVAAAPVELRRGPAHGGEERALEAAEHELRAVGPSRARGRGGGSGPARAARQRRSAAQSSARRRSGRFRPCQACPRHSSSSSP